MVLTIALQGRCYDSFYYFFGCTSRHAELPQLGKEPAAPPPAVEVGNLNHQPTREALFLFYRLRILKSREVRPVNQGITASKVAELGFKPKVSAYRVHALNSPHCWRRWNPVGKWLWNSNNVSPLNIPSVPLSNQILRALFKIGVIVSI